MARTKPTTGSGGTALITGASSGIGRELAHLFAGRGHDLVLVARGDEQLQRVGDECRGRGVQVTTLSRDLGDPRSAPDIVAELEARSITVDVLVNNAGFATFGLFAEIDADRDIEMIRVNVVALTHLTKLLLPGMLTRRRGRILNVASTAAFQPGPLMAVYYATKAYVLSLSVALANETKGTGVTVTALCPGPTRTGFQRRAAMEDSRLVAGTIMDARTVARAGYEGMLKGRAVVVPGLRNQIGAFATRLAPRSMAASVARRMQERVTAR
jgi:short-subunit dehydrogenase